MASPGVALLTMVSASSWLAQACLHGGLKFLRRREKACKDLLLSEVACYIHYMWLVKASDKASLDSRGEEIDPCLHGNSYRVTRKECSYGEGKSSGHVIICTSSARDPGWHRLHLVAAPHLHISTSPTWLMQQGKRETGESCISFSWFQPGSDTCHVPS